MANLREVQLSLSDQFSKLEAEVLLKEIGLDLLSKTGVRIFERGKNSDGGDIIDGYSTKPMYVPVKASSKLTPLGKQGKSTFKSGKKKKSRYLRGGYKELKSRVGRTLPLELTGQFKGAYTQEVGKDTLILGFQDVQRKTFASGVTKSDDLTNDELRLALEDKYGVFTAPTDEENEKIFKIVEDFINRINK